MKTLFRRALLACVALLFVSNLVAAPKFEYIDASTLTVIGQPIPYPEKPFYRMNVAPYGFNGTLTVSAHMATGMAVLFTTNSPEIRVKWETPDIHPMGAMLGALAQKGFDLYIKQDGKWLFAGSCNQKERSSSRTQSAKVVEGMNTESKECLLYLPLFARIHALSIGVEEGSTLTPLENPFRHRIVFHGSSITHGSAASRAGMAWPARFAREYNLYCFNMGFAGNCKLQPEYARYLADTEADAFVFDTFSNPTPQEIETRLNAFIDILREAHPTKPLIFVQTIRRERRNFNLKAEAFEAEKQAVAERLLRERMKQDKHLYFIPSDNFLGDDGLATVDGTHPNDLGFTRMLKEMTPPLRKILRKYGIR